MTAYLRPIGAVGLLLILAGCAASGTSKPATEPPLAQNAKCMPQSGTRIAAQEPDYSIVGRCYSRTDIERTGATTAADALPLLDPAITIQH
jgi:hypothetical protein